MAAEEAQNDIPAGSIKIDQILFTSPSGKSLNLLPIVVDFSIYESLVMPFMTVELSMVDSLALQSVMPIIGEESIAISFSTPHKSFLKGFQGSFIVTSIKNLQVGNQAREAAYILRAHSPMAIKDWTTSIRKSYADKPISEMVKLIFTEIMGGDKDQIEVSESEGERTIVIPNMKPSDALAFLGKEAYSSTYVPSNFCFWQTADKYYFKTIEELIKKRPSDKYTLGEKNTPDTKDATLPTNTAPGGARSPVTASAKPKDFLRINDFQFVSLFDLEKNIRRGMYDNSHYYINPTNSIFEKKVYNYKADQSKFQHTTTGASGDLMYGNGMFSKLAGDSKHIYTMTNKDDESAKPDAKWDFFRFAIAASALNDNLVCNVTIPGSADRRAGDVIALEFPEFGATDDVINKTNKYISGEYLVTSVRQVYHSSKSFFTVMQCIKNCYQEEPPEANNGRTPGSDASQGTPVEPTVPDTTPAATPTGDGAGTGTPVGDVSIGEVKVEGME